MNLPSKLTIHVGKYTVPWHGMTSHLRDNFCHGNTNKVSKDVSNAMWQLQGLRTGGTMRDQQANAQGGSLLASIDVSLANIETGLREGNAKLSNDLQVAIAKGVDPAEQEKLKVEFFNPVTGDRHVGTPEEREAAMRAWMSQYGPQSGHPVSSGPSAPSSAPPAGYAFPPPPHFQVSQCNIFSGFFSGLIDGIMNQHHPKYPKITGESSDTNGVYKSS